MCTENSMIEVLKVKKSVISVCSLSIYASLYNISLMIILVSRTSPHCQEMHIHYIFSSYDSKRC